MQQRPINIAILTYNALEWTKICIESIRKNTRHSYRIYVLDNLSKDGSREWLKEVQGEDLVVELSTENLGVPGGRNKLIELITPHLPEDGWVVFLDNDMELLQGWDDTFLSFFADHPEVGIASAWGHRMTVGQTRRDLWPHSEYTAPVDVACGGFCCWVRSAAVRQVSTFDTALGLFWHEDDDYTVRLLKAGFEAYALPHAPLIHHEHKSGVATPTIKIDGSPKNQAYLAAKWRSSGIVGALGRVKRPARHIEPGKPRQICAGVEARGVSRNQGGYHWMERRVRFSVSPPTDSKFCSLAVTIKLATPQWYRKLPQQVIFSVNQRPFATVVLTAETAKSEIKIPIERSGCTTIDVQSSSTFHPKWVGFACDQDEPVGLVLERVALSEDHASTPLSAPEIQHPLPTASQPVRGVHIVGNFCSGDDASLLTRHVVRLFESQCIPVRLIPIEVESRLVRTAGLLANPDLWSSLCTADVEADWAVVVAAPGQLAQLMGGLREKLRQASKGSILALAEDLKFYSAEERAYFDQFSLIWLVSDPKVLPPRVSPAPLNLEVLDRRLDLALDAEGRKIITMIANPTDSRTLSYSLASFFHGFRGRSDVAFIVFVQDDGGSIAETFVEDVARSTGIPAAELPLAIMQTNLIRVFHPFEFFAGANLVLISQEHPSAHLHKIELSARSIPWIGVPTAAGWIDPAEFSDAMQQLAQMMERFTSDQSFVQGLVRSCLAEMGKRHSAMKSSSEFVACLKALPAPQVEQAVTTTCTDQPYVIPAPAFRAKSDRITIGVDARCLTYAEAYERGIGHYTFHHLQAAMRARRDVEFQLLLWDEETSPILERLLREPNAVRFNAAGRSLDHLSLFHVTDPISLISGYDSPFLMAPPKVPASMVFFDLIPLVFRQDYLDSGNPASRRGYFQRIADVERCGSDILAISESTRADLLSYTKINARRVVNISAGYNEPDGSVVFSQEHYRQVASKLGIEGKFFMTVGGLDPHKDFPTTMNAFIAVQRQVPVQFVVVGSLSDPYKHIYKEKLEKLGIRSVIFTGYLSREELVQLYGASSGLVYPSRYEGFGFPVLEAMANRCPVITTNTSSLPEVVGDAGVLVPPGDSQAIADAMQRLMADHVFTERLRDEGYRRSQLFRWGSVAEATWRVWDRLLQGDQAAQRAQVSVVQSSASVSLH